MTVLEIEVLDGVLLEDFLKPIDADNPAGVSVREEAIYSDIQADRASDDPNLPRGVWERDLKKADWQKVSDGCQNILTSRSKDLQVAVWLLESQIYLNGIQGLAKGLMLIAELTDHFWNSIFPLMEDDDIEYRTNLFSWVNDRLSMPVRWVAISDATSGEEYSWADWERAQLENNKDPKAKGGRASGLLNKIKQSIDATDIQFYQNLWDDLSDAEYALDYLSDILAKRFDTDAPSMTTMREMLAVIRSTIETQTDGRVIPEDKDDARVFDEPSDGMPKLNPTSSADVSDRQRAYMLLGEVADYLAKDDPHSPVPYLVYKAIDWGRLSTSELYEEIFVRCGGSIHIFELLGIEEASDKKS